ncbi:DNA primase family protein [Nitrincola sp. A-D6]|uniref:DNA primase family protein n=1 Tax=Nitrincola sp. A-D6 TaxID=1545442 RepID=UPI00068A2375|nr:DNA primase family protein [Nitrincola sp. A-D6]
MRLPFYSTVTCTRPAKNIGLNDLLAMASAPSIGPKNAAAAITPFHSDGKTKDHAESALYSLLVIDHDNDHLNRDQLSGRYDAFECAYLAFTTSSHLLDGKGRRWKVIIILAEAVTHAQYIELAGGLALMMGADDAQARGTQVFYAPNKLSANSPYEFIDCTNRPALESNHWLAEAAMACMEAAKPQTPAKPQPKPRNVSDDNGIITKICAAYSMNDLLESAGYKKRGSKYLSPNSSTGAPGVVVLERDGKELVYSHHSASDPLSRENHNGHALDTFDVAVALFYGGDDRTALAAEAAKLDPQGQRDRQRAFMAEQRAAAFGTPAAAPQTDLDLAHQLAAEITPENVLTDPVGVWYWSNNGVWSCQDDRAVKQWVQNFITGKVDRIGKSKVDSIADLFKNHTYKSHHEFDIGPPECVNAINGEITLINGAWSVQPHNREHYRTTQIPVSYNANAPAPRFNQFMVEIFNGDNDASDKRTALLEMIGYSLMAHCRHEKFIILVGSGANGKSVLLAVLEALLGSRNVAGVQPSQFGRSFQRAHLHSKLANIVTEIRQGEIIDDASLKGIVSGEPTTVEHKFKNPFVMRPFSTCWFGTNHMPHTRDFSDALFRRALVVEFNNRFKPALGNCDPQLKDKLLDELPGILRLSLDAYAKAVANGFTTPTSCQSAKERWRLEADQVAQFIESECEPVAGERIPPQQLFNAYRVWAGDNGIQKKLTQRSFLDRLVSLGYERQKSSGIRYICGLKYLRVISHSGVVDRDGRDARDGESEISINFENQ